VRIFVPLHWHPPQVHGQLDMRLTSIDMLYQRNRRQRRVSHELPIKTIGFLFTGGRGKTGHDVAVAFEVRYLGLLLGSLRRIRNGFWRPWETSDFSVLFVSAFS
jgi:hypothetical protein